MKKLIFVLLVACYSAGVGYSQSLSLSLEGIDFSNDTLFLIGNADAILESHVSVTNETDKEIEVLVKRTYLEIIDGTINTFCWGASCYPPNISEATQVVKIAANSTNHSGFIGDYSPDGNEGTSVIRYTFFIAATPSDTVSMIVYYQVGAAGVRDWTLDPGQIKLYPNPASDQVTVRFPTVLTQITELVLIDITGQTVYKQTLYHGAQIHRLSLSQLPQGNYFLLISDQQGASHSKKLIINR